MKETENDEEDNEEEIEDNDDENEEKEAQKIIEKENEKFNNRFCMRNTKLYGIASYEMSLRKAINLQRLNPYRLYLPIVTKIPDENKLEMVVLKNEYNNPYVPL